MIHLTDEVFEFTSFTGFDPGFLHWICFFSASIFSLVYDNNMTIIRNSCNLRKKTKTISGCIIVNIERQTL
jgi:hypothetical protein